MDPNVEEFLGEKFHPELRVKIEAILGLHLLHFADLERPEIRQRSTEEEIVLRSMAVDEPGTAVTIRSRERGYLARLSFTCNSNHGFDLAELEKLVGPAKIEPKDSVVKVRILIDRNFDCSDMRMVDFFKRAHESYLSLQEEILLKENA